MRLFELPRNLVCRLLSVWFDLKEVVNLDTATSACSEKRAVLYSLLSMKGFVVKETVDLSNVAMLKWLIKRSTKIESFELDEEIEELYLPQYLRSFGQHIHKAELEPNCDAHGIRLLANYCRNLTSICSDVDTQEFGALCDLLHCNRKLTELRIVHLTNVDVQLLEQVTCSNLHRLSLTSCPTIRSFPWRNFVGPQLRFLHLESLYDLQCSQLLVIADLCPLLECCAMRFMPVRSEILANFTASCPGIVNLDLAGNDFLTDTGVESVVSHLPKLKVLVLHSCWLLTSRAFEHIATHCKHTLFDLSVDVDVTNITALSSVLQRCECLRVLAVDAKRSLNIAQLEPLFAHTGKLRGLSVSGTLMSDAVLCLVGKHCHELRELTASSVTDHGGTLPVHLDAAPCALAYGCPHLQLVELDGPEIIPATARRLWNSIRPHLRFEFDAAEAGYNLCD